MTKVANSSVWVACLLGSLAMASGASAAQRRELMVHTAPAGGSAENTWICRVDTSDPKGDKSVLIQHDQAKDAWMELTQIPAGVQAITSDDRELIILLDPTSGVFPRDWAWVSSDRFAYGPALPDRSEILALSGNGADIWALGRVTAPASPTTAPATQPSAPGGAKATTRPAARVALFKFTAGWSEMPGTWPAQMTIAAPGDVSMKVIGGTVTVAVRPAGANALYIWKYAGGHWEPTSELRATVSWQMLKDTTQPSMPPRQVTEVTPPRYFHLLALEGKPALWIQPGDAETSPCGILWTADGWSRLEMPPGSKLHWNQMDLAIVKNQPRLYYVSDEKLMEQGLARNGKPTGKAETIAYGRKQAPAELNWITITVMAVLTVLILNTVLRRRGGDDKNGEGRDGGEE